MTKYVRVMDGDISNQSGRQFKIGEITTSDKWDPNATKLDTIKGINFSTEESIIRWIRRGDTIYDVELPEDAQVIKVPGTFTPDGIYRTNKIIVKNPRKLTEEIVMDLYKKSNIPDKTYHDVLAILAIKKFENVCMQLIRDRITKDNIDEFLNDYIEFGENDIKDNNYGLYEKYKEILKEIKSNLDISLFVDKEPLIKQISEDKIINITGESGSGKSTYAKRYLNNENYIVIDTDEIFKDNTSSKECLKFGKYLKNKYINNFPKKAEDFDILYQEILEYYKNTEKTLVIDSAQYRNLVNKGGVGLIKGRIIILRTSVDKCYIRCINRWKENHPNYKEEDFLTYAEKKKGMYSWYKLLNKFINKINTL